jgi:flagellar basal body rod protein FlgB
LHPSCTWLVRQTHLAARTNLDGHNIDIDKEEEDSLENSEEFQTIIERAVSDQETLRVLDAK